MPKTLLQQKAKKEMSSACFSGEQPKGSILFSLQQNNKCHQGYDAGSFNEFAPNLTSDYAFVSNVPANIVQVEVTSKAKPDCGYFVVGILAQAPGHGFNPIDISGIRVGHKEVNLFPMADYPSGTSYFVIAESIEPGQKLCCVQVRITLLTIGPPASSLMRIP